MSATLILLGGLIVAIGLAGLGFNYHRLKETAPKESWYNTIHTKDKYLWYGIDLGNGVKLFAIGNSD